MPCMCGDLYCHSCGPAQGNSHCPHCGAWTADGGCLDPASCNEADRQFAKEEEAYDKRMAADAAAYYAHRRAAEAARRNHDNSRNG